MTELAVCHISFSVSAVLPIKKKTNWIVKNWHLEAGQWTHLLECFASSILEWPLVLRYLASSEQYCIKKKVVSFLTVSVVASIHVQVCNI
jgi:hypothetical protein